MGWKNSVYRIFVHKQPSRWQFGLSKLFVMVTAFGAYGALAHLIGMKTAFLLVLYVLWLLTPIWMSFCLLYFDD